MPHDPEVEFPADVIPLQYHFNMLQDAARTGGLKRAIEMVVRPGMRVVELGGGTGVLSWFAARQGAAEVWCVEKLPSMAEAARAALDANPGSEVVTVVNDDANDFLPPDPVDVVICEMLHVGLLREQQVAVIGSFRRRYLERFGEPLPAFVPCATLQAVQPVQQDFVYSGYYAATPVFQDPTALQPRTLALGTPRLFQSFTYDGPLPERCEFDGPLAIDHAGTMNAIRIITKNVLALSLETGETAEWIMSYLVVPLPDTLDVEPGDTPTVTFSYAPGDELPRLTESLRAHAP